MNKLTPGSSGLVDLGNVDERWKGIYGNVVYIGNGTDSDTYIYSDTTSGPNKPSLRYSVTLDRWEFSNNGSTWNDITSATGHNHDDLYAKKNEAVASTPGVDLGGTPTQDKVIVANDGTATPPAIKYDATANEWQYRTATNTEWTNIKSGISASDHSALHTNFTTLEKINESAGLPTWNGGAWPGGTGGASDWSQISNKPLVFAPDTHTHNVTDINNLTWSSIGEKPTKFAPDTHTHVVADITDAAALTSVEWANVQNKPTKFTPDTHTHTNSELSEISSLHLPWANIDTKPTKFAPDTHTHVVADITDAAALTSVEWTNVQNKPTKFAPDTHVHDATEILLLSSTITNHSDVAANTAARHNHTNIESLNKINSDEHGNFTWNSFPLELPNYLRTDGSNQITGTLIPNTSDAYDLGSNTNRFNNVFAKALKLNGTQIVSISTATDFYEDSDQVVPTQKAIKSYVDTKVSQSSGVAAVTFESLNSNGDVGTGADQIAIGNHNHSGLNINPLNVKITGKVTYDNSGTEIDIAKFDSGVQIGDSLQPTVINGSSLKYGANTIYHAGNLDAANIVFTNDSRLTDSRTPKSHGNEAHNEAYIKSTDITYTLLNTNGIIGNEVNKIATGDHVHTGYIQSTSANPQTLTGSITITGDLTVNGTPTLTGVVAGDAQKLTGKVPNITPTANSVLLSDATGKIDENWIPDSAKGKSNPISVDTITFQNGVKLVPGRNVTLTPNETNKDITISTLIDSWKSATQYKTNEVVTYGGKLYQAICDHTSSTQFGADFSEFNIKWRLLSISNVVSNWNFDKYTIDKFLVNASEANPYIISAPLTEVTDISNVQVELLKFVKDDSASLWTNIKITPCSFIETERSEFTTNPQVVFDGNMKLKTEYVNSMSNQGTLGGGNYWKVSLNRNDFKSIKRVELIQN